MNRLAIGMALALLAAPLAGFAGANEDTVQKVLDRYVPEHSGFAMPKVKKVTINPKNKTITIDFNESTTYVPLTKEKLIGLKAEAKTALGPSYGGYSVTLRADKHTLDELAPDAKRKYARPKETKNFVEYVGKEPAPLGLDGANIAMWQSHGWYFEPKLNRWEWQRARIFETVEDLYTQSYVVPFLMPMLTNAGAYVMSPRDRDIRSEEIIIDNDAIGSGYYERPGGRLWRNAPGKGFGHDGQLLTEGVNPFERGTARMIETSGANSNASAAEWNAPIPESGDYAIYVSYKTLPNSATDATYTINAANGPHTVKVNQSMGGGTWVYLGHFPLLAGKADKPIVELSSASASGDGAVVVADAVKIGGGIGNVARIVANRDPEIDYQYVSSGYPRFTEGARYWLQWAGAPDSVYTPTDNVNDYNDDYLSRPKWVNWLAGGSSVLPGKKGLNVPVDLAFAFHSDAGTTPDDSIIGTLGIYCTDSKKSYANGTDRLAARDLTNLIMTEITEDIRTSFEPNWMRRGMWDKGYAEARIPEVPTMLLELLSHQNFADMKYGLDPAFRFLVSRAIYKGMLKFIAQRDGRDYVVQPLPVRAFAINGGKNGQFTLSWAERVDSGEPTAKPASYIVEERVGSEIGFKPIATVFEPKYVAIIDDNEIHSYRIIAANSGGVSFPSEVLALCYKPASPQALIVNAFTRVSAPDYFDLGGVAGFYDERDHGVPYLYDISFIGSQYEFRRVIPWMDDDAAGFGGSRSDYETKVIAGNTFDYVALHGQSLSSCGWGFISCSAEAFADADMAQMPKVADIIMGKQKEYKTGTGLYGTRYKTFPAALKNALREYTEGGGSVFVSGAFIATDLWDNPYSDPATLKADQNFAASVLGYKWRVGQASVTGEAHEVASRFKAFDGGDFKFVTGLNPKFYAVESPDAVIPANKNASTIMRYSENNIDAGVAYAPDKYKTVVIGFPFECIADQRERHDLMSQILKFFKSK